VGELVGMLHRACRDLRQRRAPRRACVDVLGADELRPRVLAWRFDDSGPGRAAGNDAAQLRVVSLA
jgi:hypothetical protein